MIHKKANALCSIKKLIRKGYHISNGKIKKRDWHFYKISWLRRYNLGGKENEEREKKIIFVVISKRHKCYNGWDWGIFADNLIQQIVKIGLIKSPSEIAGFWGFEKKRPQEVECQVFLINESEIYDKLVNFFHHQIQNLITKKHVFKVEEIKLNSNVSLDENEEAREGEEDDSLGAGQAEVEAGIPSSRDNNL